MSLPYGQPPVSYVPGRWVALVAGDVALLADAPADSAVLASCWTAVVHGAGVDGVLVALAQAGPGALPDFTLVGPAPDGSTRVVVSGSARLEVHAGGPEPTVLTAGGTPAVRDERVPGRPAFRLVGSGAHDRVDDGADGVGPAALPLDRGVVLAGAVGLGIPARTVAPAVPVATPPPPGEDAPVPSGATALPPAVPPPTVTLPAAEQPPPQPVMPDQPTQPEQPKPIRVSSDTMPPRSEFDSGLIDSLPWRTPDSFADAPPEPVGEPPVAEPVAESAPSPSWGDPSAGAESHPMNPWPTPGTPPGGAWGAPDAAPQFGWPAPAAPDNPWAPSAPGPDADPAGMPAPPVAEGSGPLVHAFACPRQHLNPPYAGTCRVCGEPIPPQEGFTAPRPQLGVLTLSTGDTVPLDRDVVLGRAPFHADANAASRPHLVQLSSPGNDISRSHLRVNLENWFVQVTDLGSTNGTVVTLPDQAPVRLRPHDPFTILPGTTVNIADEVTLRFDAS